MGTSYSRQTPAFMNSMARLPCLTNPYCSYGTSKIRLVLGIVNDSLGTARRHNNTKSPATYDAAGPIALLFGVGAGPTGQYHAAVKIRLRCVGLGFQTTVTISAVRTCLNIIDRSQSNRSSKQLRPNALKPSITYSTRPSGIYGYVAHRRIVCKELPLVG